MALAYKARESPGMTLVTGSIETSICVIHKSVHSVSETFIRTHSELLPANVTGVHFPNGGVPCVRDTPVLSQSFASRGLRALSSQMRGMQFRDNELTTGYATAFRRHHVKAVLAEYGPVGVEALDACRSVGIPLVVHFHGYDASVASILEEYGDGYRRLFKFAAAIVAVSREMERRLLAMGAPRSRLFYNPYGIDGNRFTGASPTTSPPTFLAVGRFVEKKAPFLTIFAFSRLCQRYPETQLRMIGDGPLLGPCRDLAKALDLEKNVSFLGLQGQEAVGEEMKRARAFVQHSVEASNGDCEGTPVAILEASATGLPIVATRHAGIPDVVVDGETGYLVGERDTEAMAKAMERLLVDPELAGRLGRAGQQRARTDFSMERSMEGLWNIISSAINGTNGRR